MSRCAGVDAIMSGYRARSRVDDGLLAEAGGVFDALYAGFRRGDGSVP